MIRTLALSAVTACLLAATAGAAEPKPPLRLAASSQWVVDSKNDSCQLRRAFGEGEKQTILTMTRYGVGEEYRVVLGGAPMQALAKGTLGVQFGPKETEQPVGYHQAKLADGTFALFLSQKIGFAPFERKMQPDGSFPGPPALGKEREKAVTFLKLRPKKGQPVILGLGAMDRPMAAMQQCVDDMVARWGIDVDAHKNLKSPARPKGNPGMWITSNDYPDDMLNDGQSAFVEFRVDVDEQGKAVGCHVQDSTRPKAFDDAVCGNLIARAKFQPAIGADGKPVRSYWRNTVNFATW